MTRPIFGLFPKQCLHYGVLAEHKGPIGGTQLPAQSEQRKTHNFFWEYWLFQKQRSWRSSFEVARFSFCWMFWLIFLFLLKHCLWVTVTRSPKGYQGRIWAPICSDMGADFPGWLGLETPPEPPEILSRALLDPLGRLESLSPWSMVLGPWSLVPDPWIPGPWSLVPCAWI
mgnify:CR=1 FL=1